MTLELAVSISMSAPMPDDRSFHVLEAVPNRLEASPQRARRRWSTEAKARLIEESLKWAPLLRLASAEIGGIQIQNRGTISLTHLPQQMAFLHCMLMRQKSIWLRPRGSARYPLINFFSALARRRSKPAEFITEIRIPKIEMEGTPLVFFEKAGPRKAQAIAKASVVFHA